MRWRRAGARTCHRELSCCHNPAMERLKEEDTHTHTYTHMFNGGVCVCEVGSRGGRGAKKDKVWEGCKENCWERVFENCRQIFVVSSWSHTHFAPQYECCDSSWCGMSFVARGQAPVVYPKAYPKTISLPVSRHAILWGFGHTSLLISLWLLHPLLVFTL